MTSYSPNSNTDKTQLQRLTEKAASGDRFSENQLIEFFLPRALNIARRRISGLNQAVSDHEDLANSAIKSLCMRIRDGRIIFHNDNQLMGVMKKIIANKANKVWRYHTAEKRDINKSADVSPEDRNLAFAHGGISPSEIYLDDGDIKIDQVDEPTVFNILHSLELELQGLFTSLLSTLEPYPRQVMILLLERDYTNEELARKIDRSLNSIARYRNAIRESLRQITNDVTD